MSARRLWTTIGDMSEEELRLQVIIPVLRATPGISNVTDVHGQNERGLDVIFFTESDVERLCYGLQLKRGNISGGGTGSRTVKQIVDQLELAEDFDHPIATKNNGVFRIDRFIVATSGNISSTARDEIARRHTHIAVRFWDGNEIIRRIHKHMPQLFQIWDGASASYLKKIIERFDVLDALDQIPGVARRTLTQIFEEPKIRRIFDPSVGEGHQDGGGTTSAALRILENDHNAVLIAEQDSGKTSILRMLALRRGRDITGGEVSGAPLPLLIHAKTILGAGFTVEEAVAAEFRKLGEDDLASTVEEELRNGHYYLSVDGFSELLRDEDKQRVEERILAFANTHESTRIVVAARPADFLKPRYFPDFFHYRIEDFDQAQSASLVRRWAGDSPNFADVAAKMVARLREALQLPGSPIPATIGVMLHEEQGRFITNTAEAIDRYMVIRLGRYAHELGLKQEVDWARKQDLLAEIAFAMVEAGQDSIAESDFIVRLEEIQQRQGDTPRGVVVLNELIQSGVLHAEGGNLSFFRSSFRDFFAGHHLYQRGDLDEFAPAHLFDRRWGGVIVFAAGLRRSNARLLDSFSASIARRKAGAIDGILGDDYFYGAYLTGRTLANSESADHGAKVAALRTTVLASSDSIPELEEMATEQFGNIGHIMALIAAEQSFFVTVGVPWLRNQFLSLIGDQELSDNERYFIASTYTNLGYENCFSVLDKAIADSTSTRVLLALQILLLQLERTRKVTGAERAALESLQKKVQKRLAKRDDEIRSLLEVSSKALKIERERMKRLANRNRSQPAE